MILDIQSVNSRSLTLSLHLKIYTLIKICRFLQLVFVREYRGLMNLEILQYRVMQ
jgi:hypothetical protein